LLLRNAAHVTNVRGRKTDVADAVWLCHLPECGLLRGSFVAPEPVRELRELTRRRRTLVRGARARGQPAAQGTGGHGEQARLRRDRHPRRLGPADARGAAGR
jgi:hypothetical protein